MADIGSARAERVHERFGWMLLAAGAFLGILLAAVITTLPPLYWFTSPRYQNPYPIITAWSITWLGFNVFALILALIPYKRGERRSSYAL
jgi:hypothetical protein